LKFGAVEDLRADMAAPHSNGQKVYQSTLSMSSEINCRQSLQNVIAERVKEIAANARVGWIENLL
jgi:hypothetical protein